MNIVGIDPGVTGALACFRNGALGDIVDMPVERQPSQRPTTIAD